MTSVLERDERGSQVADFAVVAPLLIMVIFGILWFGRALNIYTTVHRATREAAEAAAIKSCATCGNTPRAKATIENTVVNPILTAAHLDPGLKQGFDIVPMPMNPGSPITVYRAQMNYPYNFKLNGITCCPLALAPITLGVTISAQAQAQAEN